MLIWKLLNKSRDNSVPYLQFRQKFIAIRKFIALLTEISCNDWRTWCLNKSALTVTYRLKFIVILTDRRFSSISILKKKFSSVWMILNDILIIFCSHIYLTIICFNIMMTSVLMWWHLFLTVCRALSAPSLDVTFNVSHVTTEPGDVTPVSLVVR